MKLFPKIAGTVLLCAFALGAAPAAHAQVNVNINAGPPAWGPAVPQGTQFYYIPEIDGYYDLYAQQYIVFRNGQWVPVAVMNGYDPRAFHPVVLDYRGRQPWMYVRDHRARYPRRVVVVQPGRGYGRPRGGYQQGYQQGRREEHREDRREDHDDRGRGNGHNGHGNDNGNGHSRGRGRD